MTSASSSKVALVTGGSRGIGRACVVALAEQGFNVVFSYASNKQAAQDVETTVKVLGQEVLSLQSDVGSPANAQFLVDETMNRFGRLDVLVNNAGVTRYITDSDERRGLG